MTSLFTSLLGNHLGDLLNDTLGLEPTEDDLRARYEQAFAAFDADKSATLELDEVLDAFATVGLALFTPR
jgi:Ca2+-binding EF-hand superfamily protein